MASKQFCTFKLGDYFFGIDILQVQEIIRRLTFTRIPLAPPLIQGLVNLRGQIVTAIDLRQRLGLPDRAEGASPIHVVVHLEDGSASLLVDEIGDMMELEDQAFEGVPDTVQGQARDLISGVYKLDQRLLLVLDIAKTVTLDAKAFS
jgi:purine-binding chemotaxis protein CheW